jgi:putative flippase GtrA
MTATGTLGAVTDAAPTNLLGRLGRCMSVSVITTALSLALIVVGTTALGLTPMTANVLATAIATVPSYSLNRRWTWARRDRSDPWREVFPFWVLSFCGLALSTVTVGIADSWASRLHLVPVLHTGTILVGHLGGFGLLWSAQFVLLDRVLFARSGEPQPLPENG